MQPRNQSLDNVFGKDALRKWASRLERLLGQPAGGYTVEPKIDGLAIAARYVAGRLTLVATRGDGRAGEDVTAKPAGLPGCRAQLREPVTVEVRGEVFMTDADFAEANAMRTSHGEPAFPHPRSALAGTLRAQDRPYDAPLSFIAYAVHGLDGTDGEPMPHSAAMARLDALGVATTAASSAGMPLCPTIDEVTPRWRRCTPAAAASGLASTARSSRPTSPPTESGPASLTENAPDHDGAWAGWYRPDRGLGCGISGCLAAVGCRVTVWPRASSWRTRLRILRPWLMRVVW